MAPSIRPFTERDQGPVVALSLRAWAPVFASLESVLAGSGVFARLHPDWRTDQRHAVEATCQDARSHVWVAVVSDTVGDTVAGFVAAQCDDERHIGEVTMLAVDPQYQRRGIGSALMTVAEEWLTASGMTVLMVDTGGDPGHAPARRTYERAGYTQLPVARFFKTV